MADFDSVLDELRAIRADKQRIPSYDVADTAVLVDGIETLIARVAGLEQDNAAMVRHLDALEDPNVADDEVAHHRARVAALEVAGGQILAAARSLAYTWETRSTDKQMWDAWSKVGTARTAWMDALRAEGGAS